MYTFECLMKYGHVGAGRSNERSVRVRADNIIQAMRRAKNLPGVKKGALHTSCGSVIRVALVH